MKRNYLGLPCGGGLFFCHVLQRVSVTGPPLTLVGWTPLLERSTKYLSCARLSTTLSDWRVIVGEMIGWPIQGAEFLVGVPDLYLLDQSSHDWVQGVGVVA